MLKRVVICDFDGVLFYAIRRPSWCRDRSISTIVPESPSDEWYLGESLRSVREIAAQENSYVCCWVGSAWSNKDRVQRLLDNVGVWFDEYVLLDGPDELECRLELVRKLLGQFPELQHLDWWLGASQNPTMLRDAVENLGVRILIRQVSGRPPKVLRGISRLLA